MRVSLLLALSASALLTSASVQAHSHPATPNKDVHVHMASAFAHHEVATLPPGPMPVPSSPVVFLVPAPVRLELLALEAANKPHVAGSVPLVSGPTVLPATPPPNK